MSEAKGTNQPEEDLQEEASVQSVFAPGIPSTTEGPSPSNVTSVVEPPRAVIDPQNLAAEILKTFHLTTNWQTMQGITIDPFFIARFDTHRPVVDFHAFEYVRQSLFFTGNFRGLLGQYNMPQPYPPTPQCILMRPEIMWAECLLTAYRGASPDTMYQSLVTALGGEALANTAIGDRGSCALKATPKKDGEAAMLPIEQVRKQANAFGFGERDCPPSGLLVNGEDELYDGSALSSVSGYLARYHTDLGKLATVLTFVAGKNAHRQAPDKLVGICGMLRSLSLQLLIRFRAYFNFAFLNDQYLCEICKGSFVALLYLFKHLICTIAWQRGRTIRDEITVVVDGIHNFEGIEYVQQWSNFVLLLRELVYRILEVPDANSAYLRLGLNFKYVLIHPMTSALSKHPNEVVIFRSLAPPEPKPEVSSGDDWSDGSAVEIGGHATEKHSM